MSIEITARVHSRLADKALLRHALVRCHDGLFPCLFRIKQCLFATILQSKRAGIFKLLLTALPNPLSCLLLYVKDERMNLEDQNSTTYNSYEDAELKRLFENA